MTSRPIFFLQILHAVASLVPLRSVPVPWSHCRRFGWVWRGLDDIRYLLMTQQYVLCQWFGWFHNTMEYSSLVLRVSKRLLCWRDLRSSWLWLHGGVGARVDIYYYHFRAVRWWVMRSETFANLPRRGNTINSSIESHTLRVEFGLGWCIGHAQLYRGTLLLWRAIWRKTKRRLFFLSPWMDKCSLRVPSRALSLLLRILR